MAIILKRSVYFKITRTGSNWVRNALYRACEVVAEIKGTTEPSVMILPTETKSFTFIRHPVTWHQSMYSLYTKRVDSKNMSKGFSNMLSTVSLVHFRAFVETFLQYNRYYRNYIDGIARTSTFVGRQENLADDLVDILRKSGENFDERVLRETTPSNVSSKRRRKKEDSMAVKLITDAYSDLMEKYGYTDDY